MIASAITTCSTMRTVYQISMSAFLARRARDREKLRRDERRTADQSAVHFRHREERCRVCCLHAPAVQDAQVACDAAILLRHPAAQERMHVARLLGRRVAAGADRPYRLVRQHPLLE